jgi:hypothetical protein
MPLPIRLSPTPKTSSPTPAQPARPPAPTPAEIEGLSSGRNLRPVQEVVREQRPKYRDAPDALPWGPIVEKLPVRMSGG